MTLSIEKVTGVFVAGIIVLLGSSCRLVSSLSTRHLAQTFENTTATLSSHPDPELVRQAFPTFLILLDSVITSYPKNLELLYAGSLAYSTFCQAFLVNETDMERTSKLYKRAKEYGFRLLKQKKICPDVQATSVIDLERILLRTTTKDVPYLYASASAWLGWILANAESMEAMADLPKAMALLQRVMELDESYNNGAGHLFFGIYYAVQPRGAGQDLEKSNYHFTRAVKLGGNGNLLPLVTYAEYYATAILDAELFSKLLTQAMETNLKIREDIRLLNELALRRARTLWENRDEFF